MPKKVSVIEQDKNGRNTLFKDNYTKEIMTDKTFAEKIKNNDNNYQDKYHIRVINGVETPCSNPDDSSNNNLG